MAQNFDLDFVPFRCRHPKCGEIFEKSLVEMVDSEDVTCPRCGTAARISEENSLLLAAKASQEQSLERETSP